MCDLCDALEKGLKDPTKQAEIFLKLTKENRIHVIQKLLKECPRPLFYLLVKEISRLLMSKQ